MHLVVFDVDGTLTRTSEVDASCYSEAVSEHLGTRIDTDWSTYRHTTDAGILEELLERHGPAVRARVDIGAVRRRFLDLLRASIATDPGCCDQVPGANEIIQHLRRIPEMTPAIATGGWAESAKLKLLHACIDVDGIAFASCEDALSREEILAMACRRAALLAGVPFETVTYVGDGLWDVAAARSMGLRFVGVACNGKRERLMNYGAPIVFTDFTDQEAVLDSLLHTD